VCFLVVSALRTDLYKRYINIYYYYYYYYYYKKGFSRMDSPPPVVMAASSYIIFVSDTKLFLLIIKSNAIGMDLLILLC